MTKRLSTPDTETDLTLRKCLKERVSFIMIAGAGSGKTTSLIKALAFLKTQYGSLLKERSQNVACITYTDIATDQILKEVGIDPIFHVSTIHSFLWTLIRPFQDDVRAWVGQTIDEKIASLEVERNAPKVRETTRQLAAKKISRYQTLRELVKPVRHFSYGTGSDYENGILGHDDIIKMVPALIIRRPLLQKLLARKYPFFFVDESQDTLRPVVDALKCVKQTMGGEFCLGFFGDPMQQIYSTGIGKIEIEDGWSEIKKPENFRCPSNVLNVINNIRLPVGDLIQNLGREESGRSSNGTVRVFILPADSNRDDSILKVRHSMARESADPLWISDEPGEGMKMLVLVHRAAATRLGFGTIYSALNDRTPEYFKTGLAEGTLWVVKPFLDYLLPLIEATKCDQHQVVAMLRRHSPRLNPSQLSKDIELGSKVSVLLESIFIDVAHLAGLLELDTKATVLEVLRFVQKTGIFDLDRRFDQYLSFNDSSSVAAYTDNVDEEEERTRISEAMKSFLDAPAAEFWGYRKYINDETPFSTQHGTKGDEFARVLVVMDDDESKYNLYSYDKLFGLEPFSDTDKKNLAAGRETVVDRTRRLFYVCCSRSYKDLAAVLFTADVDKAIHAFKSQGIFDKDCVKGLADL